ncbi:MAG: MucR family transcriptional regulator [Solidesulfovibrio sp. DCME]|uniref:MucR family transcriptional regulator n=1 Tax=Solidesulfovibrio sp. DCME TaxID=3447380 RepID=UPI003D0E3C72
MSEVAILKVILEANPGLSIDDALKLTDKAIKSLSKTKADIAKGNTGASDDVVSPTDNKQQKHQYTQADFKFNPMQALQGDKATCVLCGKKFDVISKTHLWVSHGITPEEYRNLCGYSPTQRLMTETYRQQRANKLKGNEPWKQTNRWKDKQAREAAAREAASQAVDGIDTDDKSTPKETPKAPKSDAKPQANASGTPEKKDDKGDNAPKS